MKHPMIPILLAATVASADSSSAPKPVSTDPKLAQLVGRWEGSSKFTIRGTTMELRTSFQCARAVVGPPLVCTTIAAGGERRLEEVHLIGYDKASDRYHLFTVNNWGEAYDHVAAWSARHDVSFVHDGTRDGKPLREVYRYQFKSGGKELVVEGEISLDGTVFATGISTVKRAR